MATVRQRASGSWQVIVQVRQPNGRRRQESRTFPIARYRRAAIDAWLAARETANTPTTSTPAVVTRKRRSHT